MSPASNPSSMQEISIKILQDVPAQMLQTGFYFADGARMLRGAMKVPNL